MIYPIPWIAVERFTRDQGPGAFVTLKLIWQWPQAPGPFNNLAIAPGTRSLLRRNQRLGRAAMACYIDSEMGCKENQVSTLNEIEQAVSQLSPEDLAAFWAWFAEFDSELWDQQFEEDVNTGRLDDLAAKALKHLHKGRCTDL